MLEFIIGIAVGIVIVTSFMMIIDIIHWLRKRRSKGKCIT